MFLQGNSTLDEASQSRVSVVHVQIENGSDILANNILNLLKCISMEKDGY